MKDESRAMLAYFLFLAFFMMGIFSIFCFKIRGLHNDIERDKEEIQFWKSMYLKSVR